MNENEKLLYEKAFEFVAASGNEDPAALAAEMNIGTEEAERFIHRMREQGDIASDDTAADTGTSQDTAYEDTASSDAHSFGCEIPIHVIEDALSFIGDVVAETGEKICDVLDESLEKVLSYDFGD
ncbi:MAG: hypothetical protein ACTTKC_08405 [Treponema sp.]|uniref:hypothetical protein n=1 Tax=Treponema sp. TaxID=166 RepID=UPI003FA1D18F